MGKRNNKRQRIRKIENLINKFLYQVKLYLSMPWILWLSLAISIYTVIVIDLELIDVKFPELYTGGYKWESIFYQLAIGYIVSFMFYYIVVFVSEVKMKEAFKNYLSHEIRAFYHEIFEIVFTVKMNRSNMAKGFPADNTISELFAGSRPLDRGHLFKHADLTMPLYKRMENLYFKFSQLTNNISARNKIFDGKLDSLLSDIEYKSGFFFFIKRGGINPNKPDLAFEGTNFVDMLGMVRSLSEYCRDKYGIIDFDEFCNSTNKEL